MQIVRPSMWPACYAQEMPCRRVFTTIRKFFAETACKPWKTAESLFTLHTCSFGPVSAVPLVLAALVPVLLECRRAADVVLALPGVALVAEAEPLDQVLGLVRDLAVSLAQHRLHLVPLDRGLGLRKSSSRRYIARTRTSSASSAAL